MVPPVKPESKVDGHRQEKPQVVEIIGPAGAGKTTIFSALSKYPEAVRLGDFPDVRRVTDAPFFIKYGFQLIPSLFHLFRHSNRKLSRREFAWMIILTGWPFILQRDIKKSPQVIVLDQGPVYLLAEMREFGPEILKGEGAAKFWKKIYRRWAATLDMVVWLDAEDNCLMERIRIRNKEHMIKDEPSAIVIDFLDRYRRAFDHVLSRLEANTSGPRVLRIDTGKQQPGDVVNRILVEFGSS
jgi:shikimate kinase